MFNSYLRFPFPPSFFFIDRYRFFFVESVFSFFFSRPLSFFRFFLSLSWSKRVFFLSYFLYSFIESHLSFVTKGIPSHSSLLLKLLDVEHLYMKPLHTSHL